MSKNQIHYNDAPIEQKEVKAWFHGEQLLGFDEHRARLAACHVKDCETEGCHEFSPRFYAICDKCRAEKRAEKEEEKYRDAESRDYQDGDVLYSNQFDEYFFSLEDLESLMEEDDIAVGDLHRLQLYFCNPIYPRHIDMDDHLSNDLAEENSADEVLSDECIDLVEKLNTALMKNKPISYFPSNIAVNLDSIFIGETPCDK
ncbi:hypothetical protein [Algicola sagamiensis]|uniref:hypothetical protein n=1 Tax=Algicola sagamiensis TaxID=163869 RepID=UPI0003622EB3|nr:hypothetical protein [Algicola sagamiensis]